MSTPVYDYPYGPPPRRSSWAGWIYAAVCAVVLAVAIAVLGSLATTHSVDGRSYEAGRERGTEVMRGAIGMHGSASGFTDDIIRSTCQDSAGMVAASGTYFGKHDDIWLPGSEVHQADFVKGCVDGSHAELDRS